MPFTVQRVLTARTQLAAILVLSGATIVVLVYTSVQIIIENKVAPSNITDSALFSRDDIFVLWNGTRLALFFSSFLVIFVSVVTLMIAFKKSARFQRQAASSGVSTAVTVRSLRDTQIIKGIFQVLAISTLCNSRLCIDPVLSVWSIISGTVNIIAFYRIGLRDGVNQNFFILSVADTLHGFVALCSGIFYVLESVNLQLVTVTFSRLQKFFGLLYGFPLSVSIITTTVIAVVRCCCVTMPFTVQRVLTARRQLAAILVLSGATMVVLVYTYANINLERDVASSNITDSSLFSSPAIVSMLDGTRLALFFSSFLVILVSMVTLIITLKKSARFQQQAASSGASTAVTVRSVRDARIIKGIIQLCIDPVLSVWSIISGTVNIIAFYRIGLRDGVNQNFFILSVADTLQGFVGLGSGVCYILEWANLFFRAVTFSKLQNLFLFVHSFPLSVSIITTTVIAVVRCCCVTMPFTVQRVLTARRQLAAILVLTGATIIIYIFASAHITRDSDGPSPNTTNTFFFSSQAVLTVWDGTKCALFFSSFLVISVSIVTLIIALKKSSRFQQRATTSGLSIVMESRSVRDARVIRGILQILQRHLTTIHYDVRFFKDTSPTIHYDVRFFKDTSPTIHYDVRFFKDTSPTIHYDVRFFKDTSPTIHYDVRFFKDTSPPLRF
ncbi:hypothetical protein RRG08_057908 [Elysia crispata]|uniref:G-protein coupled receptors family 1 profile domain-containing protein n=1 Tax=Elysia crispata TaxID=231223 RepID=A0AAE0ZRY4_9GAST|nr:hypothetical protein RRG08_057908 [Elysia crispata]